MPAVATEAISPTLTVPQDRLMALGTRLTLALRAEPRANAAVVAQVPGAQAFWAEGRSADGRWLWVTYGEKGDHGWLPAADARLLGEAAGLPVTQQVAAAPTAPAAPAAGKSTAPGRAAARPAPARQAGVPDRDRRRHLRGERRRHGPAPLSRMASIRSCRPTARSWRTRAGARRTASSCSISAPAKSAGSPPSTGRAARPGARTAAQLAFTHVTRSTACRATPFGCLTDDELRARFGGQDCLDTPFGRFCIDDFPMSQIDQIGVARVGADGQGWQDVVSETDAQSLTWRPRQDEFLFRSDGGLQTIAADGRPQELVHNVDLNSPAVSPDGQRIAVQMHLHDHKDIFLLDAAGQIVQRLTTPPYGGGHAPDNVAPAWSPDGKTILFLSNRDGGAWRLYRMNADGSDQAPFLPGVLKDIPFR